MDSNKYIVVKILSRGDEMGITKRDNFETISLGDCYNNYGIRVGDVDEEMYDIEVEAWTYCDGSNFRSLILSTEAGVADVEKVDEELESAILAELPNEPLPSEYEEGVASVETENYIFSFSQFASDPFYCRVEYK